MILMTNNNFNNNNNPVFRDLPQRVLGEVISTPNSSRLRGRRKEDPDNKVVWEKEARLLESCKKSLCRENGALRKLLKKFV